MEMPDNFSRDVLEAMNEKSISNQFFTPDTSYIDIGLMKDIPIGAIYSDLMASGVSEAQFTDLQAGVNAVVHEYQKRDIDTIDPYLGPLGYTDASVDTILADTKRHALVFALAPATRFFDLLIRHTVRNSNHSRPANKFTKKKIDDKRYTMEAVSVTYYINTFPLTLPNKILIPLGQELGEALGVNIKFLNKDPAKFDQSDWDDWLEKVECFYFDKLGVFTGNSYITEKQGNMEFAGSYFFARKRFEKDLMEKARDVDFDQQIAWVTSTMDVMCEFAWLQNNDVRLTDDKEDVPVDDVTPQDEKDET